MSTQQIWFEKLSNIRNNTAQTLMKDFAISNIWQSVTEKYSEQAHFIYELIQNANDANATKSSFKLTTNGLFFKHNGTKNFWVSNPETEELDQKNNKLGDINAITAVAQSNKKDQSTIGKFGVGFKAVFQYSETPHIYDPNFQFKICSFIVPIRLEEDLSDRQNDETIFYFPFDKQDKLENGNLIMPKEKAYSDVLEKLKNLIYPTLFLTSLRELKWQAENEQGIYSTKIIETNNKNNINWKFIESLQLINSNRNREKLYLFTRVREIDNVSYSIGFFLDKKNELTSKKLPAFCFFPTKETTNLNFIIHAPFLLTDSREGIHRSKEHNSEMINLLSELSSESLLLLRDFKLIKDSILNIIPYRKNDFFEIKWMYADENKPLFFAQFYKSIKKKIEDEALLPAIGCYVGKSSGYWAQDKPLLNLFSDDQLALLTGDKGAKWVFRSLLRNQTVNDYELREYIEECSKKWYDMSTVLKLLNTEFIKQQTIEWLHKLYEYLGKNNSYWDEVKTKPIFLNQEGSPIPAFSKIGNKDQELLFLPSVNIITAKNTILPKLLENNTSKRFFEEFGIKEPNEEDEIYIHIFPMYDGNNKFSSLPHFKIFFNYWKNKGRPEEFLRRLKEKNFIIYKKNEDERIYRGRPDELYFPSVELIKYFESKPNTKFVALEKYIDLIDENEIDLLKDFFTKLGVSDLPRIIERKIDSYYELTTLKSKTGEKLKSGSNGYSGQGAYDKIIDGCSEIVSNINKDKSLTLWTMLSLMGISNLEGVNKYFYYSQQQQHFESTILTLLKKTKWLVSKQNEFVSPTEISISELNIDYNVSSNLENLLSFKPTVILTQAERIASKFESEADADLAKTLLEEYKAKRNSPNPSRNINDDIDNSEDELPKKSKIERTIKNLDDLQNEFKPKQKNNLNKNQETETKREIVFDEDVEFAKGIEDLKNKLEIKKSRVDLAENIINSREYSFDWFKSYLKLLTTYSEKQDNLKQKSISFQDIKPYKADNKYFLLCGANGYISHEIENSDDFKVSLIFGNGKRENIIVEGVSKKGQDLLIYCREPLSNNTLLRLPNIFKVEINFTPVIDLLDRLYKVFTNDNYIDKWDDIHKTIPSLDFIYGPPGTGKTTTLCNRIIDILSKNPDAKFLVLTPTNKAADVVCKKLRDIDTDIYAVRLSHPTDPDLEEFDIYRDTLNLNDIQSINVVTSTIHRLPYFDIIDYGLLFQYEWDYVIFDESSMTGLHYITFAIMALFKSNPKTNFIVAGDPKQIPPVIEIDDKELENFDFQDENIYKMMNLISFNPKEQKIREIDRIQNLDKQYRSIPKIGQLFSELSYSNQLKHDRTANGKEVKILPEKFKNLISSNVTFIDIPLSQDSSIYRVNKLYYSSYHTYCAILVSEIIKYFDTTNTGKQWTIGLVAPYKAQAMLMNKLITSYDISENIKVISDTVHGFQGDECDIVFFVCNPNNYSFTGHKKSLLSKEYIYNVAISRAKDYLIILHPHSINNPYINKIRSSYATYFGEGIILNTNEIEKTLFGEQNFIENNCYMSGHDNINVFGNSEMKYFIKASDTAIDVQIKNFEI